MSVEPGELLRRAHQLGDCQVRLGGQEEPWLMIAGMHWILRHTELTVPTLKRVFDSLGVEVTDEQLVRFMGDADVEIEHLDEIALRMGLLPGEPDEEPPLVQIARAAQGPSDMTNLHIKLTTYPTAHAEEGEENVVHVTGEVSEKTVNLDFDKSLLYAPLSPEKALELAAALKSVAEDLQKEEKD